MPKKKGITKTERKEGRRKGPEERREGRKEKKTTEHFLCDRHSSKHFTCNHLFKPQKPYEAVAIIISISQIWYLWYRDLK